MLQSLLSAPADQPGGGAPIAVPPLVTEQWDGKTGVATPIDPRLRGLVDDIAQLHEEPEVRAAALVALAGDDTAITTFLDETQPQLEADAAQRRKDTARKNLAAIKALAGTGPKDGYFNAEVTRVLKGSDSDRAAFLAYGADIARARDEQQAKTEQERKAVLRQRVGLVGDIAPAGSHLKQAAQAALAGDDAAVAAFWSSGYLTAANADAAAREQHLKDLEARNKAAEELSDLAKRAEKASQARTRLLAAHGDAVRALQRSANEMAGAANSARSAQRVLARPGTPASKTADLNAAKTQTATFLRNAQLDAEQARAAATIATSAADTLIETGLTYGAEWSLIVQGMSEAAAAAVGASTTAAHAIDATIATNNAQNAQAKAEAHAKQATQWRKHAEEHAKAAAKLAVAAKKQADAAKTAAVRTKKAREQAEAAEATAWAAAERTRKHRQTAEAEAANAKSARIVAERERGNAATARARAEQQAAIARGARANAEAQAGVARDAKTRSEASDGVAAKAEDTARDGERRAREARDAAVAAERAEQTAKAEAQAKRAWAARADSAAGKKQAQDAADEADRQAGVAGGAARSARASANVATGAAASARAAAGDANRAAERAWAAARKAQAAAAAADAAANRAEADARAAHAARVRADAKAAEATSQEVKAAEAANAAVRIADQAASEAVQALWSADRTRQEAEAAATEAVAASAQADIAITAATAARASSAGIAEPHNTALAMVNPFTGADIDADFVKQVAEQAKAIGAEQAAAAKARADEAIVAARKAQAAADKANAQVKPAYQAAADAANSAADAASSAAEAKQAAAQAAADGAAARAAAAGAGRADAQARADAAAARRAANEAAQDAAIAGRSAAAAQRDADLANNAATAAENDAAAARGAATRAETDAKAARDAADSAQKHADNAAQAADNALQHAIDAQKAFERAEEADRKRANQALADAAIGNAGLPDPEDKDLLKYLTPEEQELFRQAAGEADKSILDFIKENAFQLFMDLSGVGDLKSCFLDGNLVACLWTLVGLLPVGKLAGAAADLAKLIPKVVKFLDRVKDARKKLDELKDRAKRKKRDDGDGGACPNEIKPGSRVPAAAVQSADGRTKSVQKLRSPGPRPATDRSAAKGAVPDVPTPCEVSDGKLDYLFDKDIKKDDHNSPRARDNARQLRRIGIKDSPESRAYIAAELKKATKNGFTRTYRNEHGEFGVADSLISGPFGFAGAESTWEIMPDGSHRLTTVILRGK